MKSHISSCFKRYFFSDKVGREESEQDTKSCAWSQGEAATVKHMALMPLVSHKPHLSYVKLCMLNIAHFQ